MTRARVFDTQQAWAGRCNGALPFIQALFMAALQGFPALPGFDPHLVGIRQESAKQMISALRVEAQISERIVMPGIEDKLQMCILFGFCQNIFFKFS